MSCKDGPCSSSGEGDQSGKIQGDRVFEGKEKVLIFGKDTWPYTTAAREDYAKKDYDVQYVDVLDDEAAMAKMVAFSGARDVPVIVEYTSSGAEVTTGFGGTWGV